MPLRPQGGAGRCAAPADPEHGTGARRVVDESPLCDEPGLAPAGARTLRQIAAEGYIVELPPCASAMSHDSLHAFLAAPLIYIATTQLAATHASQRRSRRSRRSRKISAPSKRSMENRVIHNDAFHPEIGRIRLPHAQPAPLAIDHARLSKIFYRHPTTDDITRPELACDQHDQIVDAIQRAIRMRRRRSSVRISSCRAGAWPSTRRRPEWRWRWSTRVSKPRATAPPEKRRRSRRDGYRVPITRVRSLR